jgi:hypothetical protein
MSVTLGQFTNRLAESGLMTADQGQTFLDGLADLFV